MPGLNEKGAMLTVREAARLLNAHGNTVRRWSDQGKLRAIRIGPRGDRRFRRYDINLFLTVYRTHNFNMKEVNVVWK
jgi:excisionase family DNA binding protein